MKTILADVRARFDDENVIAVCDCLEHKLDVLDRLSAMIDCMLEREERLNKALAELESVTGEMKNDVLLLDALADEFEDV